MSTSNAQPSGGIMESLSIKIPEGYKSKVVQPSNPKLIKQAAPPAKLTPSLFMKEMALNTKQKLANTHEMHLPNIVQLLDMSETTLQKFSMVDTDQPMFQPFPSEITFQNYQAYETYEVPLVLRNYDRIPRMVKVTQEDSPYFRLISPNDIGQKVAPGMVSTFRVLFTPEENKDYAQELVCITEREKFLVPVRAIGARAILDFPDHLHFYSCPVKYTSQRVLLVRNVGKRAATFILHTNSPFCVEPGSGKLDVMESMQVTIDFSPQWIGDHEEDIIIQLNTGEVIYVSLYGAATDINVRLDKNSLLIEKTYVSLANQRTVSICNRSDVVVHFQWKRYATQQEERQQKLSLFSDLNNEKEKEMDRFLLECSGDPSARDQIAILSRTFQNRQRVVEEDSLIFSDQTIIISPMEGDVWANSTAEINIIFKPQEVNVYQLTVFCDITGRETRLPLRIKGEGLGPKLQLNFQLLDIGNVFVSSTHTYELVLANKGDIDANYRLVPPENALAASFTFIPDKGLLVSGGYQVMQVVFTCFILGQFREDFYFAIDRSPDQVKLTIQGCVIGPTFHFSLPTLNFGDVSFGFPNTITCCLTNSSLVPMTFDLRVSGDGTGNPSLPSLKYLSECRYPGRAKLGPNPKEFTVEPQHGVVRSQGKMDLKITLCSNTLKKYELALVVDIENVHQEVMGIPILARCVVPNVYLVSQELHFQRCFLKFPYQKTVRLHNSSDLPACYGVIEQDSTENPELLYSSPEPYGIVEPLSSLQIPFQVEAQQLGRQTVNAEIFILGQTQASITVLLTIMGEGPVVHVTPMKIDWGKIQVLSNIPRTIHLSNESLIPANFTTQMVMQHSKWHVEPKEGVIPPLTEMTITIFAHLNDTVRFEDKMHLRIEDSHMQIINVRACGIGTTIVGDVPFGEVLNLGAVFSSASRLHQIKLTNRGRQHHQLYWNTEGFPTNFKPIPYQLPAIADMKQRLAPQPQGQYLPVFKISPIRMDLAPGRSTILTLEGHSDIPRSVSGQLVCQAVIGGTPGKERIISLRINCDFITPIIEFSTMQLNFIVHKLPTDVLSPYHKPLWMKNVSLLPVTMMLNTNGPFVFIPDSEEDTFATSKTIGLGIGQALKLLIQFDPSFKDDLHSQITEESLTIHYLEHPHVDQVGLRGEVHFPNLQFDPMEVNFGCILNDTEMVHNVIMTNTSPLLVRYQWTFYVNNWEYTISFSESKLASVSQMFDVADSESYISEVQLLNKESNREMTSPKVVGTQSLRDEKLSGENVFDQNMGSMIEALKPIVPTPTRQEKASVKPDRCVCSNMDKTVVIGVEEVFDILPLYGTLYPYESQRMFFRFYGHTNVKGQVKAQCQVDGGPNYCLLLTGEASYIQYRFNTKEINYGETVFNQVAETEITLSNTGKVEIEFEVVNLKQRLGEGPVPGTPFITPLSGKVKAFTEQKLRVCYLHALPEVFHKSFEIQISHFEAETITLTGEGVFPRIYVDLPRNIPENTKYEALMLQARQSLDNDPEKQCLFSRPVSAEMGSAPEESPSCYDILLQMEMERLLVKEHAEEELQSLTSTESTAIQQMCQRLSSTCLPEYILDFGFIIFGNVSKHSISITNTGPFPVSFQTDRNALKNTGFSTELHRVRNLPYCEADTFEVTFDPKSANLSLEPVSAVLPITVIGGTKVNIFLRAIVTMPGLTVSTDLLEFGSVLCGQCCIITLQLFNHLEVPCEWAITNTSIEKPKIDKFLPLHLRQKLRKEMNPLIPVFVVMPPCSVLMPGQKVNVQVSFSPQEERLYTHQLMLGFAQSSQHVVLTASGRGLEPKLQFSPTSLTLGPILPQSIGEEMQVVVRNPCNFPVEFFSVEFDELYLEEEKVLQALKGYGLNNTLLLPPRQAGERLPAELTDYYKELNTIQEEQEQGRLKALEPAVELERAEREEDGEKAAENVERQEQQTTTASSAEDTNLQPDVVSSVLHVRIGSDQEITEKSAEVKVESEEVVQTVGVGELEMTPVSKAIARYLGIDLTPESCEAQSRKGICLIVYGAPLSGKTTTAENFAQYYGGVCLTIDGVVLDAIISGTPAGLRARELCAKAAQDHRQKEADEALQADMASLPVPDTAFKLVSDSSRNFESKATTFTRKPSTARSRYDPHSLKANAPETPVPPQPLSWSPPVPCRLAVSPSVGGEVGLLSCVLPEDLLGEILSDRFQQSDCFQGIVYDGLQNLYTLSEGNALVALLKAFNNRRHIYFINLNQEFSVLQQEEKAKKEEEERIQKELEERERVYLEEMDEERYEKLPVQERAEFDRKRHIVFSERRTKLMKEREARRLEELKLKEALDRIRETDDHRRRMRKVRRDTAAKEDITSKRVATGGRTNVGVAGIKESRHDYGLSDVRGSEKTDSHYGERSDIDDGTRKKRSKDGKGHTAGTLSVPVPFYQDETELMNETEKQLFQRFQLYDRNQKKISDILEAWNRVKGILVVPNLEDVQPEPEDVSLERPTPSVRKGRKEREKEKLERERLERERVEREKAEKERLEKLREEKSMLSPSSHSALDGMVEEAEKDDNVGVSHIIQQVTNRKDPNAQAILDSGKLPLIGEILDTLGLGEQGLPIPPPTIFDVVHYPALREATTVEESVNHFNIVNNVLETSKSLIEDKKQSEQDIEVHATKEMQLHPKGKFKKDLFERRKSASHRKLRRDSRPFMPDTQSPSSDTDQYSIVEELIVQEPKEQKVYPFRWVVPPGEEVVLKLQFTTKVPGQFDQTLNFELLETRRRYQLFLRGICSFPGISKDPKVVFRHFKKYLKPGEVVHKKYIINENAFHFGPLLCGKTRDRYLEAKYPDNMETLKIRNVTPMDATVYFCFQYDVKADTYLLDPPFMLLHPGETKVLTIWAYPTLPQVFDDWIVCSIQENPEPTLFKVTCRGVRPELELDKKQLHFDKMLLHRKDTKMLVMRNNCFLPVAWRISGMENLGDDFSISQDQGLIEYKAEFCLHMHFRASKPTNVKKYIRLEVLDVENIMGVVQTENIHIFAEAYDIALDLSFPKGAEGGLDFGTLKVGMVVRHTISVKNKGKYEIGYRFLLLPTKRNMPKLQSLFGIQPQKGTLSPSDRPVHVHVTFSGNTTVDIKDQPVLRCQVLEPSLPSGEEVIANIPIKLSARSIFCLYTISPAKEVNFGTLLVGNRRSRTFILENNCDFEYRYTILKTAWDMPTPQQKRNTGNKHTKGRETSAKSNGAQKHKEVTTVNQARFTVGMFTIFPAFGIVLPGAQQVINVEVIGEQPGKNEELLHIDITDRDPADHPGGIPYRLVAEACLPGVIVDDAASIFEEHHICKNINLSQFLNTMQSGGIYVEDEKKFLFHNVLVGQTVEARFKIINIGKVPCDVAVSVKPISNKVAARITDIFDVEPTRMNIPSYSHMFAVVSFTPPTMQNYHCIFEAIVDSVSGSSLKSKNLVFDIMGDGNLPRVRIQKPSMRDKAGRALLLYNRQLLGNIQALPVTLINEGTLPVQVTINLADENGSFSLTPCVIKSCIFPKDRVNIEEDPSLVKEACMLSMWLTMGQQVRFDVTFSPSLPQRLMGKLHLSVLNNQFEDTVIQLVGEGYQDDITLDNIFGLVTGSDVASILSPEEEEEAEAMRSDLLQFGDCNVGWPYTITFTMTNRSKADTVRFEWLPDIPELSFSPQIGHLHAECAKDITATFRSLVPVTFNCSVTKCNVVKVNFQLPVDQVPDWDDRLRVVKWIDAPKGTLPAKKKVVEVDREPGYVVLEHTTRQLELKLSAMVDYSEYEGNIETVRFKDTLLFQTRIYQLVVSNKGPGKLQFMWQVLPLETGNKTTQPLAEAAAPGEATGAENLLANVTALQGLVKSISIPDKQGLPSETLSSSSCDAVPFSVEPWCGVIPVDSDQTFNIKFSPTEVKEFETRLLLSIPNLRRDRECPVLTLRGRSLLPYCHFDLEDSDYISSNRRNPELEGPGGTPAGITLDPNTRVIEFTAVGVNTKNTRSFVIMNPTNSDYSFRWVAETSPDSRVIPSFFCHTQMGNLPGGNRSEIIFEFAPQKLDITESFWSFIIPELHLTVPFLLVGKTAEPAVSLDRSHINFKCVLIGQQIQETAYMMNNEISPFQFCFRASSLHSAGYSNTLTVEPMQGTVPPQSSLPIIFSFTPIFDGEVNFNLICDVLLKTQQLTMNVKVEGYSMVAIVHCEATDGSTMELSLTTVNEINFREVALLDHNNYFFSISNESKYNLDFQWELLCPDEFQGCLALTKERGTIEIGGSSSSSIEFHPKTKCVLQNVKLMLKIHRGPVYTCLLMGESVPPSIHFSFTKYDFGLCFIYTASMNSYKTTLVITNRENRDISLESLFTPTAYLDIHLQLCLLEPKKKLEVPIIFYPRDKAKYHEEVIFEINGLSKQSIQISGEGIEMKIDVVHPKHKVINFRALQIGQTVTKVVPILNNSNKPVTLSFILTPNQHILRNPKVLSILPAGEVTLKGRGGTCDVEVTFSPVSRIPQFAEEITMECIGISKPLFVIRGCCQGIEISLDQECIPFGAVVARSKATRQIMMVNTGDIGASFRWNISQCEQNFSISPMEGYITPGMNVSFDIVFHPIIIDPDIRCEDFTCNIEGMGLLYLTISGSCVTATAMKEVVHFSCQVRTKQVHAILLSNRTNQYWNLQPLIEGEHWTGHKSVIVQPQKNQPYDITYSPLSMTLEGKKHQGNIFFPLPDGTGLLYSLVGISEPPKPITIASRDVPCKTSFVELLTISNWLLQLQRFRAIIDVMKPEKMDAVATVKGLEYIDVPGGSKRDYKLVFFSYREGIFTVKVTFRNESTQEFISYIVNFKATPPSVISTIEMVTPVRQSTSSSVKVENPLSIPAIFNIDCKSSDVNLPSQLMVPPQAEGVLNFEYQPLKVGETSGRLTLNSSELGVFQYDLILKGMPAAPEKPLHFLAPLGSNQTLTGRFMNYSRQKLEYACKVDSPEFQVDKSINAAPGSQGGTEINLDVFFEPAQLGKSRATLNISSPFGGEYNIPLFGMCLPPKPQGPFPVRAGGTCSIPFKNVFPQSTTFTFHVDNPLFVVKPIETIRAKKVLIVIVSYEATIVISRSPVPAKLTISSSRSAGGGDAISWTYYLRGISNL